MILHPAQEENFMIKINKRVDVVNVEIPKHYVSKSIHLITCIIVIFIRNTRTSVAEIWFINKHELD
jgi:hypothetical protein